MFVSKKLTSESDIRHHTYSYDYYDSNSTGSCDIHHKNTKNVQKRSSSKHPKIKKFIQKKVTKKYNKVSQEVKDQFIQQILHDKITLEQAAKSKGITASTAKYLWQKYKNKMLIKRKKRQNNQKKPIDATLVYHVKEIELKKSLNDYEYIKDSKDFFKSYQTVVNLENNVICSEQIINDKLMDAENCESIDYQLVNQMLLQYLIQQYMQQYEIDMNNNLYQLLIQKIIENAIIQEISQP